jgi:enterochelin esterase-like enzyme
MIDARPARCALRALGLAVLLAGAGVASIADAQSATTDSSPLLARPDVHGFLPLRLPAAGLPSAHEPVERTAFVWVPPDYASSGRRYRSVYVLHGSARARGAADSAFLRAFNGPQLARALRHLQAEGTLQDIVVVLLDVTPRAGHGGATSNTPFEVAWGGLITDTLVPAVDRAVRTIASAAARGIAGHGFGGYGALSLATRRPELFGAVYAMSPCCFADEDRAAHGGPIWPRRSPAALVDSFAPNLERLRGIAFDAGREDPHREIPAAIPMLDALLTTRRIPHHAELYTGDHDARAAERLLTRVLPFLNDALFRRP